MTVRGAVATRSAAEHPVGPAPRRERRELQRQADKQRRRHQAARQAARRDKRTARRRTALLAGAAAGAAAVVAVVIVLLVSGTPAPTPPIAVHTVVRAGAASSVAEGLGSGWLVDDRSNQLLRFDPSSGRMLGPGLPLPGRPDAVTVAFGQVWVASMLTDTVEEVRPGSAGHAGTVVRTIPVPPGPSSLAVAAGKLWVSSVIAGQLSAIDPATGQVVASATLPDGAVRIAAGAGRVWVTGSTDTLADVDPSPFGTTLHWRTLTVGSGPLGVTTGDGAVWVADATAGTVTRVDPATGQVTGTYRAGPDPVSVAVSGGRTWVVDGRTNDVRTVGPGHQLGPVALGGTPRQLVAVHGATWTAVGNPGKVVAAG